MSVGSATQAAIHRPERSGPAARWAARAAWLLVALLVAAIYWEAIPRNLYDTWRDWSVQASYDAVWRYISWGNWARLIVVFEYLTMAVFAGAALLVFAKRSDDWFAVLVSAELLLLSIGFGLSSDLGLLALPAWLAPIEGWIRGLLPYLMINGLILLYFLFPDGRFVPRWTGWVAFTLVALISGLALFMFAERDNAFAAFMDRFGWPLFMVLFLGAMGAGFWSQIHRYRRTSSPEQRQQTKWVLLGLGASLGFLVASGTAGWLASGTEGEEWVATANLLLRFPVSALLPVSIAFSILRYRLWDIDVVFQRTLVYFALAAVILLLYIVIVGALGALFQGQSNLLAAVLATGAVALLFEPLRRRLMRAANRVVYGERDDPVTVLKRLGGRLEATLPDDEVLPVLAETAAAALKLPYVAVELVPDGTGDGRPPLVAAQWGAPVAEVERFPIVYQSARLGSLAAGQRSAQERLGQADRRLLEHIALQAAPAVHAARLTTELQRSRQEIVTAREEERRRLRRDLHDGLGPLLASQTLTIDAVTRLLDREPETARALLRDLKQQSQDALREIRRMAHALRPPALDDLGLLEAVRACAERYTQGGMSVAVELPPRLPPLPAAVEVAAFRIVQEALANAGRHADAHACRVTLGVAGDRLELSVTDDGRGLTETIQAGVGLHSMRERAAELGGALTVANRSEGGVQVYGEFPIG